MYVFGRTAVVCILIRTSCYRLSCHAGNAVFIDFTSYYNTVNSEREITVENGRIAKLFLASKHIIIIIIIILIYIYYKMVYSHPPCVVL